VSTPYDDHERWAELAAGHALHALEPDEEAAFAEHLATCATCRAELGQHELVAAQLGALATTADPVDDTAAPSWSSLRDSVIGADRTAVPSLTAARERRRARSTRVLSAAAGVILLAGGGLAAWQLSSNGNGTPSGRNAALAAVNRCEHTIGCHVVRLDDSTSKTRAAVVVSGDHAAMWPLAMSAPPSGRVFALWQMPRAGRPRLVEAGTFTGADVGTNATLAASYADTAAFAVSLEPAGITPTKPTTVLAVGNASA